MGIILCCYELGGVWGVCGCVRVHVCLDVGLGRRDLGWFVVFLVLSVGLG